MTPEPVVIIPVAEYERMERQLAVYRAVVFPGSVMARRGGDELKRVLNDRGDPGYALSAALYVMHGAAEAQVPV